MLTDDEGVAHGPFGGYTVETEALPDGRTIRYYAWPRDVDGDADAAPAPEPA